MSESELERFKRAVQIAHDYLSLGYPANADHALMEALGLPWSAPIPPRISKWKPIASIPNSRNVADLLVQCVHDLKLIKRYVDCIRVSASDWYCPMSGTELNGKFWRIIYWMPQPPPPNEKL